MDQTERPERLPTGLQFRYGIDSVFGNISAAGWMTHGGMSGWRDLGHHAVAFVLRGEGIYEDENQTRCKVGPGSLIFTFSGLRQYYRPNPGTEWTEFYLVFDGPMVDVWENFGLLDKKIPVISGLLPAETWSQRFESVLGPGGILGSSPPLVEMSRLQVLLTEAVCRRPDRNQDQNEQWVKRAKDLLETPLHHEAPISNVATTMGMASHTFRRKFGRLTGQSPARCRTLRMIDRACELMQTTTLLDKQIAKELGFCDEFYFSRRFKEITGKSPRDFRAALPRPHAE